MDKELLDAVTVGDVRAVERLLLCGADVDARDRHGQTALMLAARRGHERVVLALMKHRPNLDIAAKYGLTALMLAVVNRHEEVARRLVESGADLTITGSGAPGFTGKTAEDLAREAGMEQLASYIAAHRVLGESG